MRNIERNGMLDEIAQESSPLLTFPKAASLQTSKLSLAFRFSSNNA